MDKVRYAVVGLGGIAQETVLPAFHNADNSELTALVSGDPAKREQMGHRYGVEKRYSYEQYGECLKSVDAVYIALPNHLHREYTERAADAGVHVLCEKPMAPSARDCRAMIEAARRNHVKLMIAYRLHFEEGNLEAVRIVNSGEIGDPRVFHSLFCQQVSDARNVRVAYPVEQGGGTLPDMGVYCINAARYLFRDEPVEVQAIRANNGEPRFAETEEMASVLLRFPQERLAAFTVSFGAAPIAAYTVVGTKGHLRADPAYEYAGEIKLEITAGTKSYQRVFSKRDQFGPELIYFSGCILRDEDPEPSGEEGLVDVQVVEAAYRSITSGAPVRIGATKRERRPDPSQQIYCPPVDEPALLHAELPSGEGDRNG